MNKPNSKKWKSKIKRQNSRRLQRITFSFYLYLNYFKSLIRWFYSNYPLIVGLLLWVEILVDSLWCFSGSSSGFSCCPPFTKTHSSNSNLVEKNSKRRAISWMSQWYRRIRFHQFNWFSFKLLFGFGAQNKCKILRKVNNLESKLKL